MSMRKFVCELYDLNIDDNYYAVADGHDIAVFNSLDDDLEKFIQYPQTDYSFEQVREVADLINKYLN